MLIPTDPKATFIAFLSRTQQNPRTAAQLAAAQSYGVSPIDGSALPSGAASGAAGPHLAVSYAEGSGAETSASASVPAPLIVSQGAQQVALPPAAADSVPFVAGPDGSASRRIVSGSSRPHALDAEAADAQRVERLAKPGSLRQLEPESSRVLQETPMPRCNIPRPSDFEEPPGRISNPPGPFTTAELIPDGVVPSVSAHGRRVRDILRRAQRGD